MVFNTDYNLIDFVTKNEKVEGDLEIWGIQ